ncbi:hypothetical protein AB8Q18_04510 [Neisseriaceae bacterium CLB008]
MDNSFKLNYWWHFKLAAFCVAVMLFTQVVFLQDRAIYDEAFQHAFFYLALKIGATILFAPLFWTIQCLRDFLYWPNILSIEQRKYWYAMNIENISLLGKAEVVSFYNKRMFSYVAKYVFFIGCLFLIHRLINIENPLNNIIDGAIFYLCGSAILALLTALLVNLSNKSKKIRTK